MAEAVNSKKLLTKSYQTWRVIQAPGQWSAFYRERIRAMGNYRSAIIFPEQILGLNQSSIWSAGGVANGNTLTASISRMSSIGIIGEMDEGLRPFETVEEIYEYENNYEPQCLILSSSSVSRYNRPKFTDYKVLFSSKNDAAKWLGRYIEKQVGTI